MELAGNSIATGRHTKANLGLVSKKAKENFILMTSAQCQAFSLTEKSMARSYTGAARACTDVAVGVKESKVNGSITTG
jgi:hypothetical protein